MMSFRRRKSLETFLVLTGLIVAGLGCMSREADNSHRKVSNNPCKCYQWDDPETCKEPNLTIQIKSSSNETKPPPPLPLEKKIICDRSAALRKWPEVKRHVKLISKFLSMQTSNLVCLAISNAHGLSNLASFYLGARASLLDNTTTYVTSDCISYWCKPNVNTVIKPEVLTPGKSYRFKLTNGSILIDLGCPVLISSFTLIHPLKTEMPLGYFNSAPKAFSVYGMTLTNETQPLLLGKYVYKPCGPRAQTFAVLSDCIAHEAHRYVKLTVEENYGNNNFTSLYKFEVHGIFPTHEIDPHHSKPCKKRWGFFGYYSSDRNEHEC